MQRLSGWWNKSIELSKGVLCMLEIPEAIVLAGQLNEHLDYK